MEEARRVGSLAAVTLVVCAIGATAQDSLDWLTGTWTERRQSTERTGASPATLKITIADSVLRVVQGGIDGGDFQCRLDGTETRSTESLSKATFDYTLKCKLTSRSVQIRGRRRLTGLPGVPPQEREIQKDVELTKNGALRVRSRVWSNDSGLGELRELALIDERSEFTRIQ